MDATDHYDTIITGAGPEGLASPLILSPGRRSRTPGVVGEDNFKRVPPTAN